MLRSGDQRLWNRCDSRGVGALPSRAGRTLCASQEKQQTYSAATPIRSARWPGLYRVDGSAIKRLPERWASLMADYTYLNRIAETVASIALREGEANPLRLNPTKPAVFDDFARVLERQDVIEGRRYIHPLLGKGRVLKVESQAVAHPNPKVALLWRLFASTLRRRASSLRTLLFHLASSVRARNQPRSRASVPRALNCS